MMTILMMTVILTIMTVRVFVMDFLKLILISMMKMEMGWDMEKVLNSAMHLFLIIW